MHIYSKDLSAVAWFHEDLIKEEKTLYKVQQNVEEMYSRGPKRLFCLICHTRLSGDQRYKREEIEYIFCSVCGHVNGDHEIDDSFVSSTYTVFDSGSSRSGVYDQEFSSGKMSSAYWDVVDRIFLPKANFLKKYLESQNYQANLVKVLDVGCGSGHFINALIKSGFGMSRGFDSFLPAIDAGRVNGGLSQDQIWRISPEETFKSIEDSDALVISMMCVLVHLNSPKEAIEAMRRNSNIRYTYQKIPLWSFATILEVAFPEYRARVLGSDHTHVFTAQSLSWLEEKLGLRRVASWSFGADYLDLHRKVLMAMSQNGVSKSLVKRIDQEMFKVANPTQALLDKNSLASEIHLLWEIID